MMTSVLFCPLQVSEYLGVEEYYQQYNADTKFPNGVAVAESEEKGDEDEDDE